MFFQQGRGAELIEGHSDSPGVTAHHARPYIPQARPLLRSADRVSTIFATLEPTR